MFLFFIGTDNGRETIRIIFQYLPLTCSLVCPLKLAASQCTHMKWELSLCLWSINMILYYCVL